MNDDAIPEMASEPTEDVTVPAVPPQKQNSLWTLSAALACIWTCTVLVQVGGFGVIILRHYLKTGHVAMPEESFSFLLSLTYVDWFFALLIAYYVSVIRVRRSVREAFALKPISAAVAAKSFALGVAASIIAAVLLTRFGTGDAPVYDLAIKEKEGVAEMVLPFILLAVLVPPMEELYYRGFIFPILRARLSAAWAIGIVAVWFGLLHVAQLWGEWLGIAIVLLLGMIWTIQRHRYDSLFPSIISHWTYNICIVVSQSIALRFQ